MSLKEIALAVKLGASVESVAPDGADLPYLKRLIERYIKNESKRRRKPSPRRRAGRPHRQTNYAAQVVSRYQATAELVERVNAKDEE